MASRRSYPHVGAVTDRQAQQSLKLLWDRVLDAEASLATQATRLATQATTITTLTTRLTAAERLIAKLAISPRPTSAAADPDAALDEADQQLVAGPFATGPTAITFPGLGVVQVYSSPDVSTWAETATITRWGFEPGLILLNHSQQAAWSADPVNIGGATQAATLWLFFQIAGTWYGAGAERFRPNQTTKVAATNYSDWPRNLWYDASRWGPLASLTPTPGQPAAMLVTRGSTRVDNRTGSTDRSNLVTFSWPPDGAAVTFV